MYAATFARTRGSVHVFVVKLVLAVAQSLQLASAFVSHSFLREARGELLIAHLIKESECLPHKIQLKKSVGHVVCVPLLIAHSQWRHTNDFQTGNEGSHQWPTEKQ